MIKECINGIKILLYFTIIFGILYPLFITGIAQVLFNKKANGSILNQDSTEIGSLLVGQEFNDDDYFWGRPSSTNYLSSKANSVGINNDKYKNLLLQREEYIKSTSLNKKQVPKELITASGSGLDPDITTEAAYYQIDRISNNRNVVSERIKNIIVDNARYNISTGQNIVNVLKLNMELDKLKEGA